MARAQTDHYVSFAIDDLVPGKSDDQAAGAQNGAPDRREIAAFPVRSLARLQESLRHFDPRKACPLSCGDGSIRSLILINADIPSRLARRRDEARLGVSRAAESALSGARRNDA